MNIVSDSLLTNCSFRGIESISVHSNFTRPVYVAVTFFIIIIIIIIFCVFRFKAV